MTFLLTEVNDALANSLRGTRSPESAIEILNTVVKPTVLAENVVAANVVAMTKAPAEDPYNLARFLDAQARDYDRALAEIRGGRKESHWMWYIFPQFFGLGHSATSEFYAIRSLAEARAYLDHPVLGPRLVECADAVLAVSGRSAREIFGFPDDLKLHSCMTLFAAAAAKGLSVFHHVIEKYYEGYSDDTTLRLTGAAFPTDVE